MNNLNEQQVKLKAFLEGLYYAYSRRELIQPDPLYFLYCYDKENLEVVGLIAASLAYGRVAQILKSVEAVLASLGDQPRKFLLEKDSVFVKCISLCTTHYCYTQFL